jgi:secretion/DNA translocation related TadE-like protein
VRARTDEGSATVYLTCVAALLGLATTVTVVLGRVAVHRARAASAADLAALAAAGHRDDGEREACRRAELVAAAHGAAVERCAWDGPHVEVRVRLEVPGLVWTHHGVVRAEARAGPQA